MRNRYRKIIAACGVVTLLSLGTSAVATAQTITDLGATDMTLGGNCCLSNQGEIIGVAINNVGQIVFGATLWQDGQVTDLGTLGGPSRQAFGINDAGQVVGFGDTSNGFEQHAFIWQKDSQGAYSPTDLGTLGGGFSQAFAINAAGQVVGVSDTANGERHAALWQKDSQGAYRITDLGTLGVFAEFGLESNFSEAFGINNAGQVVGRSTNANGVRAFLWQNGVMTELGTLDGKRGKAFGINAAGQVVGFATKIVPFGGVNFADQRDLSRAVLWQNGMITNLDPRLNFVNDDRGIPTPTGVSTALAINSTGQVVGDSNNFADEFQRAELWQKDSQGAYTITELDTLLPAGSGWRRLITAGAINERGQIVGLGEFSDGLIHRYLLGPSVDLVDPVPELLTGPAVTTDPRDKERLASKGRPVLGVAADGVAQLVIRIPAKSVGDQFTLTVLNTQQVESSSQDEDGAVADVFNQSFRSSVTVTAVDTAKGPMAFALYLAPRDFARGCNSSPCQSDNDATSRQVNLQLQAGNTIPIKIVRPPVVLIHGIWSEPSTWNKFPLTSAPGFQARRQVGFANYKRTNGESIQINTDIVDNQLKVRLYKFKRDSKVAAVQLDLVTHSMGGLIARNLATLGHYQRPKNYRKGDIHKLITLDTPHLGTPLANRLDAASPLCKLAFLLIKKKVGGAVKDQEEGSPLLAHLLEQTTPIKARLIAGQATRHQEMIGEAFINGPLALLTSGQCNSLLPPGEGGFPVLFKTAADPDGHSDLVVSVISQLGKTIAVGRGDPLADPPYIGVEGIIHARIPLLFEGTTPTEDPGIGQRVIDLLNTAVAFPDFGDILP